MSFEPVARSSSEADFQVTRSTIPAKVPPPTPDDFFERFDRWIKEKPEQPAISFLQDLDFESEDWNYAELYRLAQTGAAFFRQAGLVKGDRVLLELPTGTPFAVSILGAFYLGLIPAMVAPMDARSGKTAELEWLHCLEVMHPMAVVSAVPPVSDDYAIHIRPDEILTGNPNMAGPRVEDDEMAYIQFSSGSTGSPRALLLKMKDVVFNLEMMSQRIPIGSDDNIFSWLPVYHDMGLFGSFMLNIYIGSNLTMADPSMFARSPMMWFRVIDERRSDITVGPPSALLGALKILEKRPPDSLDLSTCSKWLVGAEQVTPSLVRLFNRVTAPYGIPAYSLKPVYGMAEITLAATIPTHTHLAHTEKILRKPFEIDGLALSTTDDLPEDEILEWTACGYALSGQGLRIASPDGSDLPDRRIGSILLSSPSLYAGIINGDEFIAREGEWLDTGDLGYVADGHLFITGRTREVIIKNGRNYSPERIEDLATAVQGVGRGAAFGVFDSRRETEKIIFFVEIHARFLKDAEMRDQMRLKIINSLSSAGFDVDEVHLVRRGTLSRTTSGKIRRRKIRLQYLEDLGEPSK